MQTQAPRSVASVASRPVWTRHNSSCSVDHKFANLREFIGKSLPYFTTHHDLVDRQKASRDAKQRDRVRTVERSGGETAKDTETWSGDIANETSSLVTN